MLVNTLINFLKKNIITRLKLRHKHLRCCEPVTPRIVPTHSLWIANTRIGFHVQWCWTAQDSAPIKMRKRVIQHSTHEIRIEIFSIITAQILGANAFQIDEILARYWENSRQASISKMSVRQTSEQTYHIT